MKISKYLEIKIEKKFFWSVLEELNSDSKDEHRKDVTPKSNFTLLFILIYLLAQFGQLNI